MRPRILVVDDEEFMGNALRRVLFGYDVTSVTSGHTALEEIKKGSRFDAVLCDIRMPELDGIEFVKMLAEIEPELAAKVLFVTGDSKAASSVVGHPVMPKPIELHTLRAAVQKLAPPEPLSKKMKAKREPVTQPAMAAAAAKSSDWPTEAPTQPKGIANLDSPGDTDD